MKIFEICDTTHGLTSPHGRQLPTDAGAPEERQEEEEEQEQEGLGVRRISKGRKAGRYRRFCCVCRPRATETN